MTTRHSPAKRCLLLVDVFSHFRFEDGPSLARAQAAAAPGMASAAASCRRLGIPVIYCNDNFGYWHETWEGVLARTVKEGPEESGYLVSRVHPDPSDVVLLKSRHSAFYHTQLVPLLADLQISHLAVAGAATDACVHCTALDAHVRDFRVTVLSDAVAAASETRGRRALDHLRDSLGLRVCHVDVWLEGSSAPA